MTSVHTCQDAIDKIAWSPNSEFILCLLRKRGIVRVFSSNDPKFEGTVDEGLAGLTNALWSPTNHHILTISEFQIRLTVWDLSEGTAKHIKFPKYSERGISFSNNGKWLAVAERVNHKDVIGIYSVQFWQLVQVKRKCPPQKTNSSLSRSLPYKSNKKNPALYRRSERPLRLEMVTRR